MEEHSHVAGDSTQPAGPRVGTLHAIPPTMVRTLDLENSMSVDVLYNGHLGNRGKWPLWGVVQYFHLKKIAYCSTTVNNYWWSPPSSGCYCQGLICFWNVYQIETKLNHNGGWQMFLFPRYPWSLGVTENLPRYYYGLSISLSHRQCHYDEGVHSMQLLPVKLYQICSFLLCEYIVYCCTSCHKISKVSKCCYMMVLKMCLSTIHCQSC